MVLILSDAPPAVRTPWLPFQGPIPPVRGKCPEGTKGVGKVPQKGADEGNAKGLGVESPKVGNSFGSLV